MFVKAQLFIVSGEQMFEKSLKFFILLAAWLSRAHDFVELCGNKAPVLN